MAVIEPYSPCPCGSGQKFKWCCQKIEPFAERAQRLFDNNQVGPAIDVLNEGLRKDPNNAWLLTRMAVYHLNEGRPEEGLAAVRKVLAANPKHLGALILLTRMTLETEDSAAGAARLQAALEACAPEKRSQLTALVRIVAAFLSEEGEVPAAVRHLRLAVKLGGDRDGVLANALANFEVRPSLPAWLKNPDALSPAPESLAGPARRRFDQALARAEEGLWARAADAFEALETDPTAGPLASRNAGFYRLWLADNVRAVGSLRRGVAALGSTPEAVDLEALCQLIEPVNPDDVVELVQLSWPIRKRDVLAAALEADPTVYDEGEEPLDADDPDSPLVHYYAFLDKPELTRETSDLRAAMIPRVQGRLLIDKETASVEAYDDGRLDKLSERFTHLAGTAIPSAHPKTKVIEKVARHPLALTWEWQFPETTDPAIRTRLNVEEGVRVIQQVWPNTPLQALRGRTPMQAAIAGDAVVPLRAAVFQLELARQEWAESFDFDALRDRLEIDPEPPIDPSTADLTKVHVARLGLVPIDSLSDEQTILLFLRARRFGLVTIVEKCARLLVDRTGAASGAGIPPMALYSDLSALAVAKGRLDEAAEWLVRGRKADIPGDQAVNAPFWDMADLRLKIRREQPEEWVPDLAVILERYQGNQAATQTILMSLLDIGLIEMTPHPERRGEQILDTRNLIALLGEYGPRVTTASGKLGVSAARPEIWTPGGDAGKPAGLWTPGSGSAPQPDGGKKLIIPGR